MVLQKVAYLGEPGQRWLAELPSRVAELERRWSFKAGAVLAGGTAAYVARARTADGRDAVIKVALPHEGTAAQTRTVAAADGRGYVRLYAHDVEQNAMLQEALGESLESLVPEPERVIATLCAMLRDAWQVPLSTVVPRPDKAQSLAELIENVWHGNKQLLPERAVRKALGYAERRARASSVVVVHGDPHPANALRVPSPRPGAETGYVFVDPDGFHADPAYDLGVVLRDWCAQLLASADPVALARHYSREIAAASGLDETAIWEWGYLERVSTGLYAWNIGAVEMARPFLRTAELLS